jgi:hypothetical protein
VVIFILTPVYVSISMKSIVCSLSHLKEGDQVLQVRCVFQLLASGLLGWTGLGKDEPVTTEAGLCKSCVSCLFM